MKKLNIFHKDVKNGNQTFTVFTTKNKKGEVCNVSFKGATLDEVKKQLTDEPFSIMVEENKIGYSTKAVYNDDKTVKTNRDGEPIIRRTFYIDEISEFVEYEREAISDDII
jgi:hypothetical protein